MTGDDERAAERRAMTEHIALQGRELTGRIGGAAQLFAPRVLEAMNTVPRHEFVPDDVSEYAYADTPLPIGCDKTISQPFIVALMVALLDPGPEDRVLEVGAGLGYHAAVLASLAHSVYTVELVAELAAGAIANFARTGFGNVEVRVGDGSRGWPEHAPFDRISIVAGSERIPPALLEQLRPGGRLALPLGPPDEQVLSLVVKSGDGEIATTGILPVRFSSFTLTH